MSQLSNCRVLTRGFKGCASAPFCLFFFPLPPSAVCVRPHKVLLLLRINGNSWKYIFESGSALIQKDQIHPWGGARDQNLFVLTCLSLKLRHASPQSRYNPSLMASCPMMALMFNQSKRVLPLYCWHSLMWLRSFICWLLFTSFVGPPSCQLASTVDPTSPAQYKNHRLTSTV